MSSLTLNRGRRCNTMNAKKLAAHDQRRCATINSKTTRRTPKKVLRVISELSHPRLCARCGLETDEMCLDVCYSCAELTPVKWGWM